jgi:hypothetical protein
MLSSAGPAYIHNRLMWKGVGIVLARMEDEFSPSLLRVNKALGDHEFEC